MKTTEIFKEHTVLSFEVFPPKRTGAVDTIYSTLEELQKLHPDFISVTYGAGGSENCKATLEIASAVKNNYHIESVAHLPCIGLSKKDVLSQIRHFKEAGIENILALRGDIPKDGEMSGDFRYAGELIAFIREHCSLNVIAACYPEGHTESENIAADIRNLKTKVDAGADQLITQLFFDNDYFYRFRERCFLAGIHVPIQAGIMPVVNKKQIERMVSLCGVHLPRKFAAMMERYEHNPEAMRDAGIAYAADQIIDLTAQGVDGIHLYTMNNPYIAAKIYEAVHRVLAA
ncbi:5%2C10-methylenetetrahydrofolate reductase [[Eubacterium] contortum]|uniref:Methylenetetrahydrofolate reductase n=1 Tax=Faecalicatena contorta TaxID=39482 RepID=A0A174CA94_9FIRM|nr:methylenetetrahydrofolate reductase [NAD(P)H] [Faecalicatena contorta]CUO09707.1 5%2C10-methylenetetrahydrofolate reductase [[Eubacterium] contortum] [Faecalicatena contorta]